MRKIYSVLITIILLLNSINVIAIDDEVSKALANTREEYSEYIEKAIKKTEDKPKKTSLKNRIKRDGISETLKKGTEFLKGALTRVKKLLPHIKVRDLRIKISVSGNDAALTAIEYGAVCAAFYPFLSWLCSVLNIKAKQIDVISSFENNESYVHFHTKLCSSAIWLFIAAYGVYKEYTKLTEEQSNERK